MQYKWDMAVLSSLERLVILLKERNKYLQKFC
jgi:hypothetical protein